MKYILNWNDEYLDMQIVSGPFDEETAKQALKETVTKKLVELGIAADDKAAREMYFAAEKASAADEIHMLYVSQDGASIIYGSEYEDRYQVVDYNGKR